MFPLEQRCVSYCTRMLLLRLLLLIERQGVESPVICGLVPSRHETSWQQIWFSHSVLVVPGPAVWLCKTVCTVFDGLFLLYSLHIIFPLVRAVSCFSCSVFISSYFSLKLVSLLLKIFSTHLSRFCFIFQFFCSLISLLFFKCRCVVTTRTKLANGRFIVRTRRISTASWLVNDLSCDSFFPIISSGETKKKEVLHSIACSLERIEFIKVPGTFQTKQIGENVEECDWNFYLVFSQEIYKDRKKFSRQVFEVASSDLVNMGITVVSYTLKDVRDDEVNHRPQLCGSAIHRRRLIGSRLPPQRFRPLLLLTRQNMRSCFIYFLDIFLVSLFFSQNFTYFHLKDSILGVFINHFSWLKPISAFSLLIVGRYSISYKVPPVGPVTDTSFNSPLSWNLWWNSTVL